MEVRGGEKSSMKNLTFKGTILKRKSKGKLPKFCNHLQPGHSVLIQLPLQSLEHKSSGSVYSPDVYIINLNTHVKVKTKLAYAARVFNHFIIQEI